MAARREIRGSAEIKIRGGELRGGNPAHNGISPLPAVHKPPSQAVAESETPIPDYYYHLGLALIELGRTNQAREALEEALALSPDFPDAPSARKLLSGLGSADLGAKEPAS